jgi:hypothetical protein
MFLESTKNVSMGHEWISTLRKKYLKAVEEAKLT